MSLIEANTCRPIHSYLYTVEEIVNKVAASGLVTIDLEEFYPAEERVSIDIKDKSSIGDFMIVATGRSDRHVGAIADQVQQKLKEAGMTGVRVEGTQTCDWVVVDAGAIIIHVFRPEVREFYNIEKMWLAERPAEPPSH